MLRIGENNTMAIEAIRSFAERTHIEPTPCVDMCPIGSPGTVRPVAAILTETRALGNSQIDSRFRKSTPRWGEPSCYRCHSSYQAFTGGIIRDIRPVRKILTPAGEMPHGAGFCRQERPGTRRSCV